MPWNPAQQTNLMETAAVPQNPLFAARKRHRMAQCRADQKLLLRVVVAETVHRLRAVQKAQNVFVRQTVLTASATLSAIFKSPFI